MPVKILMTNEARLMKIYKQFLLGILLTSPLNAFAHGEEVMITFLLEFVTIVIFLTILFNIKLKAKGKMILVTVYAVSAILTFRLVDNIPYKQNITLINIIVVVVPLVIVYGTYLGLKVRFKKE